jgi:1,4-dihydroxy-2-naphthoate octaprenyltransferase
MQERMKEEGPSQRPSRTQIWLMASRPKTLYAALAPVLAGAAIGYAAGGFQPLPVLGALYCAVAIQIGTNLYNDAADFERGADTHERMGPPRVTHAGYLAPRQVKVGSLLVFASAGLVGIGLVIHGGTVVLALGLASILAGLAYTAGPFPLAYNGLGDPFVFLFFGFVAVCGTVYLQLGEVTLLAWLAGAMEGALITALLVVNNVRDFETDRAAGRRTIPASLGRGAGVVEYGLMLALAYLLPVLMVMLADSSLWVLLPLLSAPYAWWQVRDLQRLRGRALNHTLEATARLALIQAFLLSIGLLIGG